jgi:hypothetical protein
MFAWTTVYRFLLGVTASKRLAALVWLTLAVTVVAALLQAYVLPLVVGAGSASWLSAPRQTLYLVVFGTSLLVGTRLARGS